MTNELHVFGMNVVLPPNMSHDETVPCLEELNLLYLPSLPRWLETDRVDSTAMLSAFLEFKSTCAPADYAYLSNLYTIDHIHSPTVSVQVGSMQQAQIIPVTNVVPPDIPSRMCSAKDCIRCKEKRGGYQFRWYHRAWRRKYEDKRREGTWRPGESEG